MNAPQELTIDGHRRSGTEALAFLRGLAEGHPWALPLYATLEELLDPERPLKAHTSGTTGAPKPITVPRSDVEASARLTGATFQLRPGDRTLLCLPGEFIAGKMMLARALVLDLDLHLIDPRGSVLSNLRTGDRFRFAAMVPLQLHRILLEDRQAVEERFDTILLGGGPVSKALEDDLQQLGTRVWHSYGSTETVTHVAVRALNGPDRSEHHAALGDVTFDIDPRGCLVVHTPHLTTPEHTTNDLVDLLDDRHFIWRGRVDHVILSGGKKIFPEQLEARTAGVIPYDHYFTAYPDDKLGQAVMLVLETDEPSDAVLPEVLEKVTEVLDAHELPRRVTAMRSFRRTPSGKVQRELTLQGIR